MNLRRRWVPYVCKFFPSMLPRLARWHAATSARAESQKEASPGQPVDSRSRENERDGFATETTSRFPRQQPAWRARLENRRGPHRWPQQEAIPQAPKTQALATQPRPADDGKEMRGFWSN